VSPILAEVARYPEGWIDPEIASAGLAVLALFGFGVYVLIDILRTKD
jgi:hypothetical protein